MERTSNALRNNYFSILLDESTDITDKKCLSIVVQYFSTEMNNVITELFKIIELDATDCSAEKLFAVFKQCFFDYGIPFENIIGFACDNASVMLGSRDSFLTRLREIVPRVILLNCICHTSTIVAKKACKELPQDCFDLMRGVATYISGSAKRCAILKEFQNFCEIETHKILKIGETRWLSTQKCVDRLIENWSCLRLFFTDACFNDKLESATKILDLLNSDMIKSYFLFLNYALTAFNKFNAFFQSRNILVHKLVKTSKTLMKQFGQNFLKAEALNEIDNINLHDLKYYLYVDLVYLGMDCEKFLENLPEEDVLEIRTHCLNFYKVSVIEMQQRLPINNAMFKKLEFLDPVIALDMTVRNREIHDFNCILPSLPPIFNKNELAMEWRQLPLIEDSDREILQGLDIIPFWNKVFTLKNFDNNKLFPNLEILVKMLLSLPHSNAEVERIFSIVTDVRSKKRNTICGDLLNAICKIRSSFQAQVKNCVFSMAIFSQKLFAFTDIACETLGIFILILLTTLSAVNKNKHNKLLYVLHVLSLRIPLIISNLLIFHLKYLIRADGFTNKQSSLYDSTSTSTHQRKVLRAMLKGATSLIGRVVKKQTVRGALRMREIMPSPAALAPVGQLGGQQLYVII
ncbi:zinc finger protein 862-like [Prorops nasuta]|uniref:zinc finger protein 862-like n=1 Tax=Prorops nasuta TaxID=863751 RepID=UPI0034CEF8B2